MLLYTFIHFVRKTPAVSAEECLVIFLNNLNILVLSSVQGFVLRYVRIKTSLNSGKGLVKAVDRHTNYALIETEPVQPKDYHHPFFNTRHLKLDILNSQQTLEIRLINIMVYKKLLFLIHFNVQTITLFITSSVLKP